MIEFSREFEKLLAMVPEISQKRFTYLFIDGLKESIKSAVGAHEPKRLENAIQKALKFDTHQIMIGSRTMHLAHIPNIMKREEITPRTSRRMSYVTIARNHGNMAINVEESSKAIMMN